MKTFRKQCNRQRSAIVEDHRLIYLYSKNLFIPICLIYINISLNSTLTNERTVNSYITSFYGTHVTRNYPSQKSLNPPTLQPSPNIPLLSRSYNRRYQQKIQYPIQDLTAPYGKMFQRLAVDRRGRVSLSARPSRACPRAITENDCARSGATAGRG